MEDKTVSYRVDTLGEGVWWAAGYPTDLRSAKRLLKQRKEQYPEQRHRIQQIMKIEVTKEEW